MTSDTRTTKIFVALLDEGTDVWRPCAAVRLGPETYRIVEQQVPSDEVWQFLPGAVVLVEKKSLGGENVLVAIALAH
jgi:hypothetical protein